MPAVAASQALHLTKVATIQLSIGRGVDTMLMGVTLKSNETLQEGVLVRVSPVLELSSATVTIHLSLPSS